MSPARLPTAATILDLLLNGSTQDGRPRSDQELVPVMDPILALHRNNVLQWDREDDAREDDANDAMVAAAKRDIDQLNSARHGFIEAIDCAILCAINPREDAPLATESPGMAIDRLSVLVIRLASTRARTDFGNFRCPALRRADSTFADPTLGARRGDRHVARRLVQGHSANHGVREPEALWAGEFRTRWLMVRSDNL